jgi:hypothetical protein
VRIQGRFVVVHHDRPHNQNALGVLKARTDIVIREIAAVGIRTEDHHQMAVGIHFRLFEIHILR